MYCVVKYSPQKRYYLRKRSGKKKRPGDFYSSAEVHMQIMFGFVRKRKGFRVFFSIDIDNENHIGAV